MRNVIHRLLAATFALGAGAAFGAPIPLDSSNWQGGTGAHFWRITSPGSYYLNFTGSSLSSSNEYVVRIEVGNVTLDGAGKLITGSGPPSSTAAGTPNLYGVRVNGGTTISNVRVTNLQVSNKYFGVIFEAVSGGQIDGVTATGNQQGLYFWQTNRTVLQSNVSSHNLIAGILCDGNAVASTSNTIANNVTDSNGNSGIWLWDTCTGNTVVSNLARDNSQMGVVMSVGANSNQVSFNVAEGNSTGIWIESNGNSIASNVSQGNTNVGILLKSAGTNTIETNAVLRNQNAGFWLDGANGNTIRRNTVALNANWGIFHTNGSSGQSVYDNYFDNVNNAGFSGSGSNTWNLSLSGGTNEVGGANMGGNYWATPSRSGFSETAADADQNGIADGPYSLAAGNVDSLPLHAKARKAPNDSLDADLRADLVWRKPATGENAVWFMSGLAANGQYIAPVADAGWTMVGRESFDGDGNADILWRHTDGRNAIWFMNGTAVKPASGQIAPVADANWSVAGVGDFDGDGYADILWRNGATGQHAVWYMRGLNVRTSMLIPALDLNWKVAGVGDFDGAGKAEILWRNAATGQNAMWWFESYASFASALIGSAPTSWTIAGVGDFNGDGKADILWRDSSGANAIWLQNGTTTTSATFLASTTTDWLVGAVGDYNGDGKADIVWRKADGTTAVWLMNGVTVSASAYLGNSQGWTLAH